MHLRVFFHLVSIRVNDESKEGTACFHSCTSLQLIHTLAYSAVFKQIFLLKEYEKSNGTVPDGCTLLVALLVPASRKGAHVP